MNMETILNFVRQALTFIGGIFVAKGTIPAETLSDVVTNLSTVVGGIVALISTYWSLKSASKS
jgi:preprotein translocase subunit SecY